MNGLLLNIRVKALFSKMALRDKIKVPFWNEAQ